MMVHTEAIFKLMSIRDQLEKLVSATSRKHWSDSQKARVVAELRSEIEALNFAIEGLKREWNVKIDEERAKRSDFKPGLPLGDAAWDHFDKTSLKKD